MSDIIGWGAVETAKHIAAGKVSVAEVAAAHMARLSERNPAINAVVDVAPDVAEQAARLDTRGPSPDQPLFGVPITIKTNVDQAGFANSNGIPALADAVCDRDAPVVENLRAAGAVILGRTNTPEFSMRWCTSNPLHGVSLNPWDHAATPGGSSGAAAAAVASGIGAIAHGNDLGGSLRYPAFCCGVATIRPSLGRVPAWNPSAPAERPAAVMQMSVQGPIARSVADVRLALQVMARRSSHDPLWTAAPDSGRARGAKLRVGYGAAPFDVGVSDPAIGAAMDRAIDGLRAAGIDCVEMPFAGADRAARLWGDLLFADTEVMMQPAIDAMASPEMKQLVADYADYYDRLDLRGYMLALAERITLQRMASQMFDDIDLYLMPTSLIRPFENDLDFRDRSKVPMILDAQKPLHLVNLLGLPAVALPTGRADDGLPVGVQLIAPMHDDWFALDVAEQLERELGTIWQQLPGQ